MGTFECARGAVVFACAAREAGDAFAVRGPFEVGDDGVTARELLACELPHPTANIKNPLTVATVTERR